jgi:hypothetical protein
MTFHTPRFNQGLFGKANRFVTGGWQNAAETVQARAEAMEWAHGQMVQPKAMWQELITLQSAAVITGATSRWTYSVKHWLPDSPGAAGSSMVPDKNDTRFTYTTAYNLREWHNSATFLDGMDPTNPSVIVGPVGSNWNGGAFSTAGLQAKCVAWVAMDRAGKAICFFDRPNPVRCAGLFWNPGEGEQGEGEEGPS